MLVVEIEATNLCNAACLMCPREALSRPKGHMSWDTFQAVADKVLAFGHTEVFSFSGLGEPTLNPHLGRFIAYASPNFRTVLTTNGSLLDDDSIKTLLKAGLDSLILSFNGADAVTYESTMVNLRFCQTQEAIQQLVSLGNGQLDLLANVTVSNLTKDRLPAIRTYLNEMGIEQIIYSHCHSRGGYLHDNSICSTPPPPSTTRCDIFADTTFVAWNGQVLACCHDLAGEGVLADLTQTSMEELAAARTQILEEGVDFAMCPKCDDIYRLTHDAPPPGGTLNEWIYRLYENENSQVASLTGALRQNERELANARSRLSALEDEKSRLTQLVAAYEGGRFMRFMRWLDEQRNRLRR
jgi:hypothetical protein